MNRLAPATERDMREQLPNIMPALPKDRAFYAELAREELEFIEAIRKALGYYTVELLKMKHLAERAVNW